MTTSALGGVTPRQPQVSTYALPAASVEPAVSVNVAVPPPSPAPTPPVYVSVNGVSSAPDNPGMLPYPGRVLYTQSQSDAVKSAAQNTATAYGLNAITAGDQAVIISNKTFQTDIVNVPTTTTTTVIIPP